MGRRPAAIGDQATLGVGSKGLTLRVLGAVAGLALAVSVSAHPANVPIARAKFASHGRFTLTTTFDLLAFLLDQTPTVALDPPMLQLMKESDASLRERLELGKSRFVEGLSLREAGITLEGIQFPTVREVRKAASDKGGPRLPLMLTVTAKGKLKDGALESHFRFADVLGTVVLTTEFPYTEPRSEPVEPGQWSESLHIPTPTEELAQRRAFQARPTGSSSTARASLQEAKASIQAQYNTWSRAYMDHDVETLLAILTPTYTLKTAKGKLITHDEYKVILDLRKRKHSDTTRYGTEIMRITLHDGVAAVFSRETTSDSESGAAAGQPASYQHDYIDVWVLRGGKWLLQSTVTQAEVKVTPP